MGRWVSVFFFMISGYFLVKKSFSWTRVFTPWTHVLVYTILCFAVVTFLPQDIKDFTGNAKFFSSNVLLLQALAKVITPVFTSAYWFVTAYIAMLILSPYMNTLFEYLEERSILGLIAFCSFISLLMLYGGVTNLWNNIMYACLCYLIGGWIRTYAHAHKPIKPLLLLGIMILTTLVMTLFNYAAASNNSVINDLLHWNAYIKDGIWIGPVIIAACALYIVTRTSARYGNNIFSRMILTFAPSTFGIYLLHENLFGYRLVWGFWRYILPTPQSVLSRTLCFCGIILCTFIILILSAYVIDRTIANPVSTACGTRMPKKFR